MTTTIEVQNPSQNSFNPVFTENLMVQPTSDYREWSSTNENIQYDSTGNQHNNHNIQYIQDSSHIPNPLENNVALHSQPFPTTNSNVWFERFSSVISSNPASEIDPTANNSEYNVNFNSNLNGIPTDIPVNLSEANNIHNIDSNSTTVSPIGTPQTTISNSSISTNGSIRSGRKPNLSGNVFISNNNLFKIPGTNHKTKIKLEEKSSSILLPTNTTEQFDSTLKKKIKTKKKMMLQNNNSTAVLSLNNTTTTKSQRKRLTPHQKQAHNKIEKRYRININTKIAKLQQIIPWVASEETAFEVSDSIKKAEQDSEGRPLKATKLNKSMILEKAVDYILYLQNNEEIYEMEVQRLRNEADKLRKIIENNGNGNISNDMDTINLNM